MVLREKDKDRVKIKKRKGYVGGIKMNVLIRGSRCRMVEVWCNKVERVDKMFTMISLGVAVVAFEMWM